MTQTMSAETDRQIVKDYALPAELLSAAKTRVNAMALFTAVTSALLVIALGWVMMPPAGTTAETYFWGMVVTMFGGLAVFGLLIPIINGIMRSKVAKPLHDCRIATLIAEDFGVPELSVTRAIDKIFNEAVMPFQGARCALETWGVFNHGEDRVHIRMQCDEENGVEISDLKYVLMVNRHKVPKSNEE